jgi:hypothetical protein
VFHASAAAQPSALATEPQLHLSELFAVEVPDSIPFTTLTVSPDGTIVIASRTGPGIHILARERWDPLGADVAPSPVGLGFGADAGVIEIVDGDRRMVLAVDRSGRTVSSRSLAVEGRIVQAARGADGWFLATRDDAGVFSVHRESGSGSTRLLHRIEPVGAEPADGRVAAVGEDLVVTDIVPPYATVRIAPDGRVRSRWELPTDAAGPDAVWIRWFPLVPVALGENSLHTLVDLRSDDRLVLVVAPDGRLLRSGLVRSPVGFVHGVADGNLIVGSRWRQGREIVGYRWTWADGEPSSPSERNQP